MFLLRNFRNGDEAALRAVFHSAVHTLACKHYTPAQCAAWAPDPYDVAQWVEKMRGNQPFIAELEGQIAGYADLQASGYINHFFVAGPCAGQGVAKALMAHIHHSAASRGTHRLFAEVSVTAEPFFTKCGFAVELRQQVELRGMVFANARMVKTLVAQAPAEP